MVLNFTAPRYALLFINSEIYILHVINCKWRSVNFSLCMFCIQHKLCFSNNLHQSGLQFRICIKCFVSFGIKDSYFMMLENSTINFLHGCWNYCLIKTDIDVMMLFKFDIKYDKLNFKAIASMKFSFDLNLILMWLRNYVLFKWNVKKWLLEKFEKIQLHAFDRSRITFDWSNVLFDRSNGDQESIESTWEFVMDLFNFLINREFLSIDWICLFDRSCRNRESIESLKWICWIFWLIEKYLRLIKWIVFSIFTEC